MMREKSGRWDVPVFSAPQPQGAGTQAARTRFPLPKAPQARALSKPDGFGLAVPGSGNTGSQTDARSPVT